MLLPALGAGGIDLGSTLLGLCAMLLLPLVLDQLVRPFLGTFFARNKRYANRNRRLAEQQSAVILNAQ